MTIKWYKFGWTEEGFGWRRKNYFILKPDVTDTFWKVRKVNGIVGMQKVEMEDNMYSEKDAFQFANNSIRASKREKR